MKVSILTHSSYGEAGGINKYVSQVTECINNSDFTSEINIFAKTNAKKISKKTNIFINKNNFLLLILLSFKKLMNSDVLLITHINLIPYIFIFIFLNKKIILFSYGLEVWGTTKNFIYKYLIKKIKYFICMREYTKRELTRKYNLKNKIFFYLDNFIDNIKNIKKTKKQNIILTTARLDTSEKFKGIDETMESISLVNNPKFKYIVLGDGDDKFRLIEKSKKLKIDHIVKFKGYVSEKKKIKYLKISKILSMPGSDITFDTYPYRFSFLEAANYSLHILGSNPFKDEFIKAKKYKIFNFVNPKNREQIKNNMLRLLKKKNIFSKNLHKDYSKEKFCKKLNSYIKMVVNH